MYRSRQSRCIGVQEQDVYRRRSSHVCVMHVFYTLMMHRNRMICITCMCHSHVCVTHVYVTHVCVTHMYVYAACV